MLYTAVLGAVAMVMLGAWLLRDTVTLTVLRDRAPLFVTLSDGSIRNAYTLKLANKLRETPQFALMLDGLPGARIVAQNAQADATGQPMLTTRPDGLTEWRVLVTAPAGATLPASMPVTFRLLDAQGHAVLSTASVFLSPGGRP
jgi:polyferredoxin